MAAAAYSSEQQPGSLPLRYFGDWEPGSLPLRSLSDLTPQGPGREKDHP